MSKKNTVNDNGVHEETGFEKNLDYYLSRCLKYLRQRFALPGSLLIILNLLGVYVCVSLSGGQLESLMETMRAEIAAHPPVEGSYAARRGDYCIAKFGDGEW